MPRTSPPASSAPGRRERRSPAAGPHHARRLRSHRLARAVGLVTVGALAFVGTGAAAVLSGLSTRPALNTDLAITPTDLITPDPDDPFAGNALTILVVGSDLRDEANAAVAGEADGGGSDTTFLVHISGDRTWVQIVSIPRDSLVDIPACNLPNGGMSTPKHNAMFNTAFSIGTGYYDPMKGTPEELDQALDHGVACTQSTVSALTKVPITNTIVVEMTGVIGVVDALHGVTMCLDEPVVGAKKYSPNLNLPAGRVTLDGVTALDYLRARHGTGLGLEDGSDTKRIPRQQAFISNALSQALEGGLLANAPQLYQVLGKGLESVRADQDLDSVTELGGLAFSLRNLDPSRIVFTELPTVQAPQNKNRVVWTSAADAIWTQMATDQLPPGLAPVEPTDPGTADGGTDAGGTPDAGTGTDTGTGDAGTGTAPDQGTEPAPSASADTTEHLPGACYPGWVPPTG